MHYINILVVLVKALFVWGVTRITPLTIGMDYLLI